MIDLNKIEKKNILVIGDVMLDTYYSGEVKRISPEAPVPVFRKKTERSVLGGAANVAANLAAVGQNVSIMAIVGNDDAGRRLKTAFATADIKTDLLITLNRDTTVKTRLLADSGQQVIRLDVEDTELLQEEQCMQMLERLKDKIDAFDMILLSDYRKGLLTYELTQGVLQLAKTKDIPVIIDVKDPDVRKYKGAYLLKPNIKELRDLTGMPASDDREIIEASDALREMCCARYVLTTCGARGMVLVGDGGPYFIDAVGQEVFDVTGAGDTTIAYLAACIVNNFNIRDGVEVANIAAGIQVSKVGTSPVYWKEIRECLSDQKEGFMYKLLDENAVRSFRKDHQGQKVVFTNGCFDILHIGHVRYLQEAAKLGDILMIGLNSDESVKRLKGEGRPINHVTDRAGLLCALGVVDYVVIFGEDTPYDLIAKIQPDILVKGGDYHHDEVIGTDIVEARGGKLVLIPFVEGKSTTGIIKKILH